MSDNKAYNNNFDSQLRNKLKDHEKMPGSDVWGRVFIETSKQKPFYAKNWFKGGIGIIVGTSFVTSLFLFGEELRSNENKNFLLEAETIHTHEATIEVLTNSDEHHSEIVITENLPVFSDIKKGTFKPNNINKEYENLLNELDKFSKNDKSSTRPYEIRERIINLDFNCGSGGTNLIVNPGFESHDKQSVTNNLRASGKYVLNQSDDGWQACYTPDFFSKKLKNVPYNDYGVQYPHNGDAYVGLKMGGVQQKEILFMQLKEPLQAGKLYCLQYFTARAKHSNATKDFGFYFSDNKLNCSKENFDGFIADHDMQYVQNDGDTALHQTYWVPVTGTYRAKGGERYVYFGNIKKNLYTRIELTYHAWNQHLLYYYFDDFSVTEIKEKANFDPKLFARPANENQITLDRFSIEFEKGQYRLTETAKKKLEYIVKALCGRSDLKVEIYGHASESSGQSSTAKKISNYKLSKYRTNNTVKFLLDNDIASNRLYYKALGDHYQVASNLDEESQKKNQRVEIILSNKSLPKMDKNIEF